MIELRDISVNYPNGQAALRDCSLTFVRGQVTVLLGPSGAGKSTLLRCLNLLVQPSRGTVHSKDFGVLRDRRSLRSHRRRTGMVFQQHHLILRYTALQNTLMGRLGYHNVCRTLFPLPAAERRMALECLERVGLLGKAMERAESLSGGERQRVGIARALVQKPRLILADEPVASLDPSTAHKVLGLLQRISREDGITLVVSLHQVELACAYADRIIGLNQGRVVFDSSPAQLLPAALDSIYSPVAVGRGNGIAGNAPPVSALSVLASGNDG